MVKANQIYSDFINSPPQMPYQRRNSFTATFQQALLEGIRSLDGHPISAHERCECDSIPKSHPMISFTEHGILLAVFQKTRW